MIPSVLLSWKKKISGNVNSYKILSTTLVSNTNFSLLLSEEQVVLFKE